jgi:hypothetical protein
VDVVKKVVLYVVKKRREVDVLTLMHLLYLVDRELFYSCGMTLFSWQMMTVGVHSFDVFNVADSLVDGSYLDKDLKGSRIVYRLKREMYIELPRRLKEIVDKVLEEAEGVGDLERHVLELIDLNIVRT